MNLYETLKEGALNGGVVLTGGEVDSLLAMLEVGSKRVLFPGDKVGKMMILSVERSVGDGIVFVCKCECGGTSTVRVSTLTKHGANRGCMHCRNLSHGFAIKGAEKTEYRVWKSMKKRCKSIDDKNYGGRGIKVCDEWTGPGGFETFLIDMGLRPDGHTLDRIDNNKGYSKDNCRWATAEQQQNNTRRTVNLTVGEKTQSIAKWSRESGVSPSAIGSRVRRGWNHRDAIFTPSQNRTTIKRKAA